MKPFFIPSGSDSIAAIYEPPAGIPMGTAVLLVPPFGWDEQTSYRPRRAWSKALAARGFASLRIDLPGSGDSSGTPHDTALLDSWIASIEAALDWLRGLNADRVAVIALGAGGLVTLRAMTRGAQVDDLVLWGMPASGTALLRELKAFGRLEQPQTGEPLSGIADGEVRAGGHLLARETAEALAAVDGAALAAAVKPERALVIGRDGRGPDNDLLAALRNGGVAVASDPGRGWGAALDRPQSTPPTAIFALVGTWLEQKATRSGPIEAASGSNFADIGEPGARLRETAIVFEGAGRQLYAVLSTPVDAPLADGTVVLFNAGAIRRIGPNRMWTEAARRWAAAGIPVLRVDIEGIGDADGDSSQYRDSDEPFYTPALVAQARSVLDMAVARGLPGRFMLAGLCSGAFWAFQIALADARVAAVAALNPRMLIFESDVEGHREVRRLRGLATVAGFRRMLSKKGKAKRLARLIQFALAAPLRLAGRVGPSAAQRLLDGVRVLHGRGQHVDIAFSGNEPLNDELRTQDNCTALEALGVRFHALPYVSHTLKPLAAQQAAHALLDAIVEQRFVGAGRACWEKQRRQSPARSDGATILSPHSPRHRAPAGGTPTPVDAPLPGRDPRRAPRPGARRRSAGAPGSH